MTTSGRAFATAVARAATHACETSATRRGVGSAVGRGVGRRSATTTTTTTGGAGGAGGRRATGGHASRTAIEDFLSGNGSGSGRAGGGGGRGVWGESRRGAAASALTSATTLDPGSRIQAALSKIALHEAMDELGVFEEDDIEDT